MQGAFAGGDLFLLELFDLFFAQAGGLDDDVKETPATLSLWLFGLYLLLGLFPCHRSRIHPDRLDNPFSISLGFQPVKHGLIGGECGVEFMGLLNIRVVSQ